MTIRYINPITHRKAWLASRDHGLGGSDAGTVMGWNPYSDVEALFKEKAGIIKKDLEGNPYVYWGSMLEDAVAQAYAHKQGMDVLARDKWGQPCIFHPDPGTPPSIITSGSHPHFIKLLNPLMSERYPWMRCNVDGYALSPGGNVIRGLEFKTGGERAKRDWKWLAPGQYIAQVWHNTVVAHEHIGHSVPWDLVALLGGNYFGTVKVPYDLSLVKTMLERERDFWACVQSKSAPEAADYASIHWPFARSQEGETESMAIPIKAPGQGTRILAPKGVHRAVICDVVDRGEVESTWQGKTSMKHKISVHFLLGVAIPETWVHPFTSEQVDCTEEGNGLAGRMFGLQQWYTASLDKRAGYRKLVESLLEREMTREEMDDHDAEHLLGKQVQLVIKHKHVNADGQDKYYANIAEVLPADDDAGAVAIPDNYLRFVDREDDEGGGGNNTPAKPAESKPEPTGDPDDDQLPF